MEFETYVKNIHMEGIVSQNFDLDIFYFLSNKRITFSDFFHTLGETSKFITAGCSQNAAAYIS